MKIQLRNESENVKRLEDINKYDLVVARHKEYNPMIFTATNDDGTLGRFVVLNAPTNPNGFKECSDVQTAILKMIPKGYEVEVFETFDKAWEWLQEKKEKTLVKNGCGY